MGKTLRVRVDKNVWMETRRIFPSETDATISRLLFNTSLARVESALTPPNGLKKKTRRIKRK